MDDWIQRAKDAEVLAEHGYDYEQVKSEILMAVDEHPPTQKKALTAVTWSQIADARCVYDDSDSARELTGLASNRWKQVVAKAASAGTLTVSRSRRQRVVRALMTPIHMWSGWIASMEILGIFAKLIGQVTVPPDYSRIQYTLFDTAKDITHSIMVGESQFSIVNVASLADWPVPSGSLSTNILYLCTTMVVVTMTTKRNRLPFDSPKEELARAARDAVMNREQGELSSLIKRVSDVKYVLTRLDREWLDYVMDTEAYMLTRPLLRDSDVPQTAAYRNALFELREACSNLSESSSESKVSQAEYLAEKALTTWGEANDHAVRAGVSNYTPMERAALRRLNCIMSNLMNSAAPDEMRDVLLKSAARELDRLNRPSLDWTDLRVRSELEACFRRELDESAHVESIEV